MTEINITRKEEKELFLKVLFGSPFFTIFASILTTFIVGAVFFKIGGGVPIQVSQTTTEKTSTFDVMGEGKLVVVPDQATMSLGVSEEGRNLKQVQENINQKMTSLSESLKKLGIKDEDIKTTAYNFYPDYQERGLFRAQAMLSVTVKDLEKVSPTLDLVGSLGLDSVSGPSFGLSDSLSEQKIKEAREIAIEKAKDKATELAGLAGMKLGRIVNVSEGYSHGMPVPYMARDMAIGSSEEAKLSTPVEVGSSEIVVNVTLSYETK